MRKFRHRVQRVREDSANRNNKKSQLRGWGERSPGPHGRDSDGGR